MFTDARLNRVSVICLPPYMKLCISLIRLPFDAVFPNSIRRCSYVGLKACLTLWSGEPVTFVPLEREGRLLFEREYLCLWPENINLFHGREFGWPLVFYSLIKRNIYIYIYRERERGGRGRDIYIYTHKHWYIYIYIYIYISVLLMQEWLKTKWRILW
jgi:hypothetical protein